MRTYKIVLIPNNGKPFQITFENHRQAIKFLSEIQDRHAITDEHQALSQGKTIKDEGFLRVWTTKKEILIMQTID